MLNEPDLIPLESKQSRLDIDADTDYALAQLRSLRPVMEQISDEEAQEEIQPSYSHAEGLCCRLSFN